MKFSVGYPGRANPAFIDAVIAARERIHEVYFAFGDIPNGRSPQNSADSGEMPWESRQRQLDDLRRLCDAGLPLNLLLNGNCYGENALSRAFFLNLGDTIDWLCARFRVTSVTTTSPVIGKFIHQNFDALDVRASVNMGIGSPAAMDYVAEFFDSFYLKRELNRDFAAIRRAKAWCDANGKGLYMLANSGCLNDCSVHTFHDNLVAHEAAIAKMDNAYAFTGICRDYLKNPAKRVSLIRDSNYVRPEDMHLYDGLFAAAKLATRVNPNPERLLAAYLAGRYVGAVTDLLEPDNGSALLPGIVDNSRFPADFGERVASCGKRCGECGYCGGVLERAFVELE
ncbi:MAG: hypothetical protein IJ493_08045 [Clostridia bacterium]|nr:hypothetical protein [Clostridia bacterium]